MVDIDNAIPSQYNDFKHVAGKIGGQIAHGIIQRIKIFPQRELELCKTAGRMDSLPEDILWDGLGEESAPIFVVYKLLHEAFSSAPQFFRAAIVEFLRDQPDRFSAVFNREILWSIMAAQAQCEEPIQIPGLPEVVKSLTAIQRRGLWWRSDEEILREAQVIHDFLTCIDGKFRSGLAAFLRLQLEKGTGITAGNVMLAVPGRLSAYADEVVSLGRGKRLPKLEEIHSRIDEITRDGLVDVRHISIPLDLLYTELSSEQLHVRILVRSKTGLADRAEIRRRIMYIRFFLRQAFAGYKPNELDVRMAFYLDLDRSQDPWNDVESLFHREEWMTRTEFWNEMCPGANPEELFSWIRKSATEILTKENIVDKLKTHFIRTRSVYPNRY